MGFKNFRVMLHSLVNTNTQTNIDAILKYIFRIRRRYMLCRAPPWPNW